MVFKQNNTQAYPETWQTSNTERFPKIVNDLQPLALFTKRSILDIWEGFAYSCVIYDINSVFANWTNYEKGTHANKRFTFFFKGFFRWRLYICYFKEIHVQSKIPLGLLQLLLNYQGVGGGVMFFASLWRDAYVKIDMWFIPYSKVSLHEVIKAYHCETCHDNG